MKFYGTEFFLLPLVSFLYFYYVSDFAMVGCLFNNALVTFASSVFAYLRSQQIARSIPRRARIDRLDSAWPAFAAILLFFFGSLQVIFAITHLSYYRKGPLVDVFDS